MKRERRKHARASARSLPRLERGMERFRIEVGSDHDVQKGNIVGAVANESGIENEFIGHIEIYDGYSTIDLPEGMPSHILQTLQNARIMGRKMQMTRAESIADRPETRQRRPLRDRSSGRGTPRRKASSGTDRPKRCS